MLGRQNSYFLFIYLFLPFKCLIPSQNYLLEVLKFFWDKRCFAENPTTLSQSDFQTKIISLDYWLRTRRYTLQMANVKDRF